MEGTIWKIHHRSKEKFDGIKFAFATQPDERIARGQFEKAHPDREITFMERTVMGHHSEGFIQHVLSLADKYPNDSELGKRFREFVTQYKDA